MEFKSWTKEDYYNPEELNRIEQITADTAQLISDLMGIDVNLEPVKTNRDYSTIDFAEEYNRVERNIERLFVINPSGLTAMKTDWGSVEPEPFDDVDANRLEHNLRILYPIYLHNSLVTHHCGTFSSGEEVI